MQWLEKLTTAKLCCYKKYYLPLIETLLIHIFFFYNYLISLLVKISVIVEHCEHNVEVDVLRDLKYPKQDKKMIYIPYNKTRRTR